MLLVDTAVRNLDADKLQRYLPLAEEAARRYDHDLYIAIAERAWGNLHHLNGQPVDARDHLQKALSAFQELGTRWQVGRTYSDLGRLSADQGDITAANRFFLAALAEFESLGAAPDAARTQEFIDAKNRSSRYSSGSP